MFLEFIGRSPDSASKNQWTESRTFTSNFRIFDLVIKQLGCFVLLASLLLTPITPIVAQDQTSDIRVAPEVEKIENAEPTQDINAAPENNTVEPQVVSEEEHTNLQSSDSETPATEASESGDDSKLIGPKAASRPQFQIPSQPKATVDESSGALVYEYPIEMPPGRAGMTPDLSLKYDSREATRPDSIVGMGWEVTIPYIKREPLKGTQNLYSSGYFSSSLSGNLIATTDTTASQFTNYRTESDSGDYLKYSYNTDNSWTASGKDGRTYFFGSSAESRQDNPINPSQVYKWMLTRIADQFGNKIEYAYSKDNGQIYPAQITYANHPLAPAAHNVTFAYTNPANYGSTVYNSGFPVTTFRLMTTITVVTTIDSQVATREFTLTHVNAQFLKQKLVTEINRNLNLPSIEYSPELTDSTFFSYSEKLAGWEQGTHFLGDNLPYITDSVYDGIVTADFDRNGFQDVLVSYLVSNTLHNRLNLNNGSTFVESGAAWNLPNEDLAGSHATVDVNGDHLPDFHFRFRNPTEPHSMYINTGTSFAPDASGVWEIGTYVPEAFGCGPNTGDGHTFDMNAYFHDMNGDGKNDIVYFGGTSDFRVFLNNGNGFTRSFAYNFTAAPGATFTIVPRCTGDLDADNFQTLMDLNGDGLDDYHHEQYGTYLNTGSGFLYSEPYDIDIDEMDRSGFADVNGDGLVDYIGFKRYAGSNPCARVLFNNGNGFDLINPTTFPPCDTTGNWNPSRLSYTSNQRRSWGTMIDVTADGFPDIIGATPTNSVTGRVRAINNSRNEWSDNSFTNDSWNPIITPSYGKFFDINNDGVLDFITPNVTWDGQQMAQSKVHMGKASVPNRLVEIKSPFRALSVITYGSAPTNLSDSDASPMAVVRSISIRDVGHSQPEMVTQYDYQKGSYSSDPATGQKRFAGFHKVTKTESGDDLSPLRISETYFHQANGSDFASNEPTDTSIGLIGKPYYSAVRAPSGNPKKETWQRYAIDPLVTEPVTGRVSSFVRPSSNLTRSTDSATAISTAETYLFDLVLGEMTQRTRLGFVNSTNSGTYTDIPGDTRYDFVEYAVNSNGTIVKPKRNELRSGPLPSDTVTRTDHYYDNQAFGVIGNLGLVTLENQWIDGNGATIATTIMTHDEFGNVRTIRNPRGAVTTRDYDNSKSQVVSESNHFGHVTNYEYMTGLLKKVTDPNGRIITYGYSSVGWLHRTTVQNTGGNQSTFQFLESPAGIWAVRTDKELVNTILDRSWQTIDNLGRPVRSIRRSLDHRNANILGFYLKGVKEYDALGREIKSSAPYGVPDQVSEVGLISTSFPANLTTTNTLDVFDRPLSVANSIGTTTLAYSGNETMVTDANTNRKKTTTDAFGNLVRVTEFNGAEQYVTNYSFDVRDKLTKIKDALGNIRSFSYNNAGWMTRSEDIHRFNDFRFGISSFNYDLNGNVVSETQPNGVTVARVFDLLDRPITLDGSTSTGVDFTFAFDNCANGIGRVCTVTGNLPNQVTTGKTIVYGVSGVPTRMTLSLNGVNYSTEYLYNVSDEVSMTTYPDGTKVRTDFGEWGLPATIFLTLPAGVESSFASVTYHHTEKPSVITAAGGVATSYSYDASKLYRTSGKITTVNGNPIRSFGYSYDNVNNISQIVETGLTKVYLYDGLNRLTSAAHIPSAGQIIAFNYRYDAIGNIASFNGVPYTYNGSAYSNPHAVTRIGSNNLRYDMNGNLTGAYGRQMVYNWQNQPVVFVSKDNDAITAAYDETGQRFLYQSSKSLEFRPESNFLLRNNVPEIDIVLGNTAIGVVSNGAPYSTVADHLGSPVIEISTGGTLAEDTRYDPFGAILFHTGSLDSKKGYTGHQEDMDTGLVYANARYYDPAIGRFTTQDELLNELIQFNGNDGNALIDLLGDPQRQNTYSYARNNPVLFVDPNGRDSVSFVNWQSIRSKPLSLQQHQRLMELHRDETDAINNYHNTVFSGYDMIERHTKTGAWNAFNGVVGFVQALEDPSGLAASDFALSQIDQLKLIEESTNGNLGGSLKTLGMDALGGINKWMGRGLQYADLEAAEKFRSAFATWQDEQAKAQATSKPNARRANNPYQGSSVQVQGATYNPQTTVPGSSLQGSSLNLQGTGAYSTQRTKIKVRR